jgi:alpha-L-rhamnosidase
MLENNNWVEAQEMQDAPVFRKEFTIERPTSAQIKICGLGFFELYLNGKKVGDDLFVPAWSNYEPRENRRMLYPIYDDFSYRTYYMEYNVLSYLQDGGNAIGVWLGNGWYNQRMRNVEGDFYYGTPKLWFELTITNEHGDSISIMSDENLKWSHSEITSTNIYFGEKHDLRLKPQGFSEVDFDDSNWKYVGMTYGPKSLLVRQNCPTDKVIRQIKPLLLLKENNRRIYDCGENISGYVVIRSPSLEGAVVVINHSEELTPDKNELDYTSAGGNDQIQSDTYICSTRTELCHPHFTWHGFRYFEVIGEAEILNVAVVHGDIGITSSFSCSDETLNWIYNAYLRTQLTNIHCGVPSDCPHRERLGYTGDGQITAEAAMLTMDCRKLYDKWMDDIADCQDKNNGHVQHTAPFYGGGGGPGGWGGAIYRIPIIYYQMYGDRDFLQKYYPNMRLWLDYMDSRCENGLVVREEEGGWNLGDWCTPAYPELPEPYVNTYYYIKGLQEVIRVSGMLHMVENTRLLEERVERSKVALRLAYYEPQTGSYCGGVNGADAFALDIGLGNEATLASLVSKYSKTKTLDTGIFGTDILMDVLFKNGYGDLAYDLLSRDGTTSFAHMRASGATTLWESWSGDQSHNHPMFGGVVRSLFTYVLGIKQKDDSVGFERVQIEPAVIAGITWAKGHITTPHGRITVSYRKDKHGNMIFN